MHSTCIQHTCTLLPDKSESNTLTLLILKSLKAYVGMMN